MGWLTPDIPGSTAVYGGTDTCQPSWSFPLLRETTCRGHVVCTKIHSLLVPRELMIRGRKWCSRREWVTEVRKEHWNGGPWAGPISNLLIDQGEPLPPPFLTFPSCETRGRTSCWLCQVICADCLPLGIKISNVSFAGTSAPRVLFSSHPVCRVVLFLF